jgi:hypothetical protein
MRKYFAVLQTSSLSALASGNINRWNFFVDIKSALGNNPALFSGMTPS